VRVADIRTLRRALLRSGVVLCVFLAGCSRPAVESSDRQPVLKADRYDRAISQFRRVLEQNPRDARTYYERGLIYYNKGEYDKAWQDVRKAQSLGYRVPPEFLSLLSESSQKNQ